MKSLNTIIMELDNLQVELRAHIATSADEGSKWYERLETADNFLSDTIENIVRAAGEEGDIS